MKYRVLLCLVVLGLAACANKSNVQRVQADGVALRLDLARVMVRSRAYEAAVPLLQRLIGEAPRDVQARIMYATVLRQRGLYGQAVTQYSEALKLAPNAAEAYSGLGITYSRLGKHAEAVRVHRKATELAPRADMWNNLGFALYASGDASGAITALERALLLDPNSMIASNNLGFAYGKLGRYEEALRVFRTAVGESRAYLNLAVVYDQAGNEKRAAECRASARRLDRIASTRTATRKEDR